MDGAARRLAPIDQDLDQVAGGACTLRPRFGRRVPDDWGAAELALWSAAAPVGASLVYWVAPAGDTLAAAVNRDAPGALRVWRAFNADRVRLTQRKGPPDRQGRRPTLYCVEVVGP